MAKQQQLIVENFKYGRDTRRSYLTSVPGTLDTCDNAHITQGGAIQKRKAFVRLANSSGAVLTSLPAGTFGLQRTATGLLVFGSADLAASTYPTGITYQRLRHPDGATAMTAVKHSELFNGSAWVVATFADARTFGFYNGTLVYDFTNGLILPGLSTNALIAAELGAEATRQGSYTPTVVGNSLDLDGPVGAEFVETVDKHGSVAGTVTGPTNTLAPVSPRVGQMASGSFLVMGGSQGTGNKISSITVEAPGASATGTLTDATNVLPANNETITIGLTVYTVKTVLTPANWEVLRGANANAFLTNLKDAINNNPLTAGTTFQVPNANPDVFASSVNLTTHALLVTAILSGTGGNSVATTETSTVLAWGSATLTGGTGTPVALLSGDVFFTVDNARTATEIVSNINAFTGTSGYTAVASDNQVQIFSSAAAAPMPNGYKVAVTVSGNVCIGDCLFYLTAPDTAAGSLDKIQVSGRDVLGSAITVYTTLADVYAQVETKVNAGSGTHGIVAFATETYVQLSRKVTTSSDQPLTVYVITTKFGVVFGKPPEGQVTLAGTATANIYHSEDVPTFAGSNTPTIPNPIVSSDTASVVAVGGDGIYTYHWQEEFSGSGSLLTTNAYNKAHPGIWLIQPVTPDAIATRFTLTFSSPNFGKITSLEAGDYYGRWVCKILDDSGHQVMSTTVEVTFILR